MPLPTRPLLAAVMTGALAFSGHTQSVGCSVTPAEPEPAVFELQVPPSHQPADCDVHHVALQAGAPIGANRYAARVALASGDPMPAQALLLTNAAQLTALRQSLDCTRITAGNSDGFSLFESALQLRITADLELYMGQHDQAAATALDLFAAGRVFAAMSVGDRLIGLECERLALDVLDVALDYLPPQERQAIVDELTVLVGQRLPISASVKAEATTIDRQDNDLTWEGQVTMADYFAPWTGSRYAGALRTMAGSIDSWTPEQDNRAAVAQALSSTPPALWSRVGIYIDASMEQDTRIRTRAVAMNTAR